MMGKTKLYPKSIGTGSFIITLVLFLVNPTLTEGGGSFQGRGGPLTKKQINKINHIGNGNIGNPKPKIFINEKYYISIKVVSF